MGIYWIANENQRDVVTQSLLLFKRYRRSFVHVCSSLLSCRFLNDDNRVDKTNIHTAQENEHDDTCRMLDRMFTVARMNAEMASILRRHLHHCHPFHLCGDFFV
jgi:hypothetical protein